MEQQRGFTIIELMVVLMITGIILAMGMPSFLNLIEKMSTESEAKMIIEGIRTARLAAIEEKKHIVVCASNNGTSCSGVWDNGFLVYRDDDDDHTLDSGEEILFSHEFKESVLVKTGSGQNQNLFFNSNGWAPGSAESLLVCANANTNTNGYRIVINRAGRLRIEDSTVSWLNASNHALNC